MSRPSPLRFRTSLAAVAMVPMLLVAGLAAPAAAGAAPWAAQRYVVVFAGSFRPSGVFSLGV